ncbi:MAG TPA: dual specificity protein phosphatase family protein [Candidatus Binataceae bacterium]|jgi:protein-tyrosine phosphatase|nr:dual specificity protein phosphatase family protein [Candidatus Binataceae bacterium]
MEWWTQQRDHTPRPTRGDVRPTVSEITDYLLVGEYPRAHDIEWLGREHRVTAIHNLQDDEDLRINALDIAALREVSARHGIKHVRTPIQDGSADDMADRLRAALNDLTVLVGANERVYLHCNAGLNRAPTLAIAYLRAHGGMSLDEALAYVKRRRSCGPFMTILEDYFGPRDLKPET